MRIAFGIGVLGLALNLPSTTFAQVDLQKALKDTQLAAHWIYDDLPAAFAKAKETGKPLLVVFRCVP